MGSTSEDAKKESFNPFDASFEAKGATIGGIIGFGQSVWFTYITRKPIFAAIWTLPLFVGGHALLGYGISKARKRTYIVRDAVIDHYQELHPEDFEFFNNESRKFKDVIFAWEPLRATR